MSSCRISARSGMWPCVKSQSYRGVRLTKRDEPRERNRRLILDESRDYRDNTRCRRASLRVDRTDRRATRRDRFRFLLTVEMPRTERESSLRRRSSSAIFVRTVPAGRSAAHRLVSTTGALRDARVKFRLEANNGSSAANVTLILRPRVRVRRSRRYAISRETLM